MSGSNLLWTIAIVILCTFFMLLYTNMLKRKVGLDDFNRRGFAPLQDRLDAYAALSGLAASEPVPKTCPNVGLLSDGSHRILLGALKKIEAKNGLLAAVNIVLLTLVANRVVSEDTINDPQRIVLSATAILLGILIILRLGGNNHIGQVEYLKCAGKVNCANCRMFIMQRDLMTNLLIKEIYFQVSMHGIVVAVFALGLSVLLGIIDLPYLLSP